MAQKLTILQRHVKALFKGETAVLIRDLKMNQQGYRALQRLQSDMAREGRTYTEAEDDAIYCYESFFKYAGLLITQYGGFAMQAALRAQELANLVQRVKAAETLHTQANAMTRRAQSFLHQLIHDQAQILKSFEALKYNLLTFTKPFDDPDNVAGEGVAPAIIEPIRHNDDLMRSLNRTKYGGDKEARQPLAGTDGNLRMADVVKADALAEAYQDLADVQYMQLDRLITTASSVIPDSLDTLRKQDFFIRALAIHVKVPEIVKVFCPESMNQLAIHEALDVANEALETLRNLPIIRYGMGPDPVQSGMEYAAALQDRLARLTEDKLTDTPLRFEMFEPVDDKDVRRAARKMRPEDVSTFEAMRDFINANIPEPSKPEGATSATEAQYRTTTAEEGRH